MAYNSQFGDIYVDADYTYTYDDHCIIERHEDDLYYRYTLNDEGLIVKKESIIIENGVPIPDASPHYFRYDDGRMIAYEETGTQHEEFFHWENGDLMYLSFEKDNQKDDRNKREYVRSGLSVDHGYTNPPLSGINHALFMMGYFGKPSKHLESHYENKGDDGLINILMEHDYTYTIADGHVTEMVEKSHTIMKFGTSETTSDKKITSTFIYEEY